MKLSLFYVMAVIKKISITNMKEVLHLKKRFMEAKLIAMIVTMSFYFDETLILCF